MRRIACVCIFMAIMAGGMGMGAESKLGLDMRYRMETAGGSGRCRVIHEKASWEPRKTAIIICDMWDKHWCDGATQRVGQMAPVMNEVIRAARSRGVLIIHAPSETMSFYQQTPQRKRAQDAPAAKLPETVHTWQGLDPAKEPPLPIDDSDGGCDSGQKPWYKAWTRQHPALAILADDAVSDNGTEVYNLLQQRGIENLIVMGVHTNMCVLGRPFAIRAMVRAGKNVALMRDMTDTMYSPASRPQVNHFAGTDLVIEHIEKYWCPTITSAVFTGKPPFRFAEDRRTLERETVD